MFAELENCIAVDYQSQTIENSLVLNMARAAPTVQFIGIGAGEAGEAIASPIL